jgi:hypothetical protein
MEGYKRCKIRTGCKNGVGDAESYFDYLLDCKLEGNTVLNNEAIWTSMKMQLNYVQNNAAKANEDYLKLQNEVRYLKEDLEEMRRKI